MAVVETVDITTLTGSDKFPVNANDVYGLVETLAVQNIRAVKSANPIDDAFYDYVVDNGAVIEEAIVQMAEKQSFVKKGDPNLAPKDPTLYVKYFNNWETAQFQTTIRRSDIRKIIANKGTGLEEVVAEILASLSEGEGYYDYKKMRDMFDQGGMVDIGADAKPAILGGKVPANMKGVIFAIREMFNALKAPNTIGTEVLQATPAEDIRIAVSETLLNMIDITELANAFNLEKEQLFGKLVKLPFDNDYGADTIIVYDRKALGRGTRMVEYSQDIIGKGLYTNHYLTTERCYFYNSLFKACHLSVEKAYANAINELLTTDD